MRLRSLLAAATMTASLVSAAAAPASAGAPPAPVSPGACSAGYDLVTVPVNVRTGRVDEAFQGDTFAVNVTKRFVRKSNPATGRRTLSREYTVTVNSEAPVERVTAVTSARRNANWLVRQHVSPPERPHSVTFSVPRPHVLREVQACVLSDMSGCAPVPVSASIIWDMASNQPLLVTSDYDGISASGTTLGADIVNLNVLKTPEVQVEGISVMERFWPVEGEPYTWLNTDGTAVRSSEVEPTANSVPMNRDSRDIVATMTVFGTAVACG